ncbi:MAG: glycosyltransferase family 4 protein [Sumerlaeia bacterium]
MKVVMLGTAKNSHVKRWARFLVSKGIDLAIFSDRPQEDLSAAGFRVVTPEWTLLRNLWSFKLRPHPLANERDKWRAYRMKLIAEGPAVIHAHEALGYGPVLPHFAQFPSVLTPWGPEIEDLGRADCGRLKRRLILSGVQAATLISTNAEGLEEHWKRLTAAPREKFRFFSWGVDTQAFSPSTPKEIDRVCKKLGLREKRPYFLSPRLAAPNWGLDKLLKAWLVGWEQSEALRGYDLVVLRCGAPQAEWEQMLSLGTPESGVRFVDEFLSVGDLAALISGAVASVQLPRTDLLAMSVLEALACGTLPLLLDLPAYRSAVASVDVTPKAQQGQAILMESQAPSSILQGLLKVIQMPQDQRQSIGARNAAVAREHHEAARCMGRMLDVYREAIALHTAQRTRRP